MILVVGASGGLGGTTARLLLAQGRGVRAMTRQADALGQLRQLGADVVSGDMLDPASLEEWARRRYAAHRPPSAASRQPASGD